MLSSYYKATKSRALSTTIQSPETDQTSKLGEQPKIDIFPAPSISAVNVQASPHCPLATPSNFEMFDDGTKRTSETSPSTIAHQTVAGGQFSPDSTPVVTEETIVSPEAIALLANSPQETHLSSAMDADTPVTTANSAAPEQGANDRHVREALPEHLLEHGAADCRSDAAQVEANQESSHDLALSTKTSGNIAESYGASENLLSKDDITIAAAQATFEGAREAKHATSNLKDDLCLCQCRPLVDTPSLQRRAQSVPPTCGKHYTYLATWPPPMAPRCDLNQRTDVFPPNDAPLHVWIQAYALRWGVWSAEVKDDVKRAQLLEVIAEKMKAAWDTAIVEGYYVRPRETIVDMTYARVDGDSQEIHDKCGRRRTQSPSRLPAGFAREGKDQYAVTKGELAQYQITMDMINVRVQERDLDIGERVLDDVLSGLPDGRERLVERDWSATYHPSVRGRNLLMYSLWAVQDARTNVSKLNNLMRHFTKEQQKKNTQSRIELYQEREAQHLALATELKLRQSDDQDDVEENNLETDTVGIISEIGSEEAESANEDLAQAQSSAENVIINLAREALSANQEQVLLECFTTRELRGEDFALGGSLTVGVNGRFRAASAMLEEIYHNIQHVVRFRRSMRGHQPAEMIKMGHDARLIKDQIDHTRGRLGEVLKDELQLSTIGTLWTGDTTSGSDENEPAVDHDVYRDAQESSPENDHSRGQLASSANIQSGSSFYLQDAAAAVSTITQFGHGISTNANAQSQASSAASMTSPTTNTSSPQSQNASQASYTAVPVRVSSPNPVQSLVQIQADLKQSYLNEKWVPFLRKALADRGLPPINGTITLWPQIKDVLTQLGFTTEERNEQLRRFKSGYQAYAESKGLALPINGSSMSPTPSAPAQSPAICPTSLQTVTPHSWPSDAEILAAIPLQGIHGSQLIRLFSKRIGQHRPQFYQTVQRLAVINPGQMVYPRPPMRSLSRHYNTVPPPPARSPSTHSPQISSTSQISPQPQSQSQAQPGIVKLRFPPTSHSSPANLPHQDESHFPEDFLSTLVQGSRGFSFRHLPHATLKQRERMDEEVGEYITRTCKARRKNPFGQYITFTDPSDPAGPVVLHGFWENSDRTRPKGSEWFFGGEDVPRDWDFDQSALIGADGEGLGDGTVDNQKQYTQSTTAAGQIPRLKLRFNAPAQDLISEGRQGMQASAESDSTFNLQSTYGVLPRSPAISADVPRGRVRYGCQPSYGTGSINPAQLSMSYVPSDLLGPYQDQSQAQAQSQSDGQSEAGAKEGTKRARGSSGSRGAAKKRRRKGKTGESGKVNVEFEDQDDSGDYDPGKDI